VGYTANLYTNKRSLLLIKAIATANNTQRVSEHLPDKFETHYLTGFTVSEFMEIAI
jgi:ATP-dependent Lon protease